MSGLLTGVGFLIIGASQFAHAGYLISTLHDRLLAQGAEVNSFGACATVPGAWVTPRPVSCGTATHLADGPVQEDHGPGAMSWSVTELVHHYHPAVVVIGIGDTLAGYRQHDISASWVREQVHVLVEAIAAEHVGCIWLGTSWGKEGGPLGKNYARVKELSELLATATAPCEYIDSLRFSQPGEWPTFDGQHHTAAGYELWGEASLRAIMDTRTVRSLEK